MSENHEIENLLTGIGDEPVPEEIHQLAESVTAEFRRAVADGRDPVSAVTHMQQAEDGRTAPQRLDSPATSLGPGQPRRVPDVPTELADGLSGEIHSTRQPPGRRHGRRFITMFQKRSVRWSITGAVAAAVVLMIGFWPGRSDRGPGSGIAWADVVQQIRTARSAHLRITTREKHIAAGQEVTIECYLQAPDKMRQILPKEMAGQEVIVIVNGKTMLKLLPAAKQAMLEETAVFQQCSVEQFLAQNFFPGGLADATVSDQVKAGHGSGTGRLIPDGRLVRDGRDLLRFRLQVLDTSKNTEADNKVSADARTIYWFDAGTHALALLTIERPADDGTITETSTATIELNPEFADELFSTQVPEGYTELTRTAKPEGA